MIASYVPGRPSWVMAHPVGREGLSLNNEHAARFSIDRSRPPAATRCEVNGEQKRISEQNRRSSGGIERRDADASAPSDRQDADRSAPPPCGIYGASASWFNAVYARLRSQTMESTQSPRDSPDRDQLEPIRPCRIEGEIQRMSGVAWTTDDLFLVRLFRSGSVGRLFIK
jgi:hypothetical protein